MMAFSEGLCLTEISRSCSIAVSCRVLRIALLKAAMVVEDSAVSRSTIVYSTVVCVTYVARGRRVFQVGNQSDVPFAFLFILPAS